MWYVGSLRSAQSQNRSCSSVRNATVRFSTGMPRSAYVCSPMFIPSAYEYADGMNIGLQTYADLGIPVENLTVALRTDEQDLFCDWADRNEPTYHIFYSAGGNFQSRTGDR